jgi:hypothetical protein
MQWLVKVPKLILEFLSIQGGDSDDEIEEQEEG